MTLWLARALAQRGYEPIIILRGYKGRTRKSTLVDRPDAALFGDEALLHAAHFPTIVGKRRLESCELARSVASSPKTVLVLDDGLQHYELLKDFSSVCEKNTAFEHDTLLPIGRLREVPHNRIDAIVSTVLQAPELPVEHWNGVPRYYFKRSMTLVAGSRAPGILVCGLARSNDFFYAVQKEVGHFLPVELAFGDHHKYNETDVKKMEQKAAAYGFVVHCTAKDAVKLQPLVQAMNSPLQLCVWDVLPEPLTAVEPLLEAVVQKIEEVYVERR